VSGRRPPRALRTRLLLTITAGVAVTLIAVTAVFNVALARSLHTDANEIVRARAQGELAALRVTDDRITVPPGLSASIDARAWVFRGTRAIESPPVDPDLDQAARRLAGGPERFLDVDDDARLYALPITTTGGARVGTVVTGISLAPYHRTRTIALVASIALALIAIAAVGFASAYILRAALRPVARMTADAAAWSEGDLDSRFEVGPPHDEITRLAATLDGLLDRLAAGLRRERRLTAEVSHELRTPLSQIGAEIDLALRRDREPAEYRAALEEIRRSAGRIEATIDTLMATARQGTILPRGTGDARSAASRVIAACEPLAARRGVSLDLDAPADGLRAGVEIPVIERILQPLVENAVRHASGRVRIQLSGDERGVVVAVVDDGPGVAEDEEEAIFEPGVRGSAGHADGAGLGLPLARRLARAAGGDVTAQAVAGAGTFRVRLPPA
jgi:two-component system, OmpR family, sensor kinase